MKLRLNIKRLLLILFSLNALTEIISQPCLPDGITFTTQVEIDNFQTNYPNCTEIGGTVKISGEDITNLEGLNNLVLIGGSLNIETCHALSSLSGLSNIDTIGSGLVVIDCSSLTNLQGLEGINYLSNVELDFNWALINLSGLNNLDSIAGCFSLNHNGLIDLTGLDNLVKIGGCVNITWNASLVSFSGFESLQYIGDYVHIITNTSLASISSLSNLESIGGGLLIFETGLISLEGLDNVSPNSISNLSIYKNGSLADCEVESICEYLTSPNGTVNIYNNAEGCNSPPEIAYSCGNTMPCLPYGAYFFDTQQKINNFQTDYPGCSELSGDVFIMNEDLDSLSGLTNITSISGNLVIFKTFDLTTLDGLDSLNSVGGDLYIGGYDIWPHYGEPNSHLEDITALMNLNHIGKDLIIKYNPVLPSLTGLDSIVFQPINDIEIGENEMLSVCSVKSLCDCLDGNCDIDIYSNTSGCNSTEEVEAACLVSVPNFDAERELIVYPNPATNNIFIFNKSEAIIDKVVIYNYLGQEVFYTTEKLDKIDISKLGQGIFIIELNTNKCKIRKKLIIN